MQNDITMQQFIVETPISSDSVNVCDLEKLEAYRVGYSTWKDSSEIRYFIEYQTITKNGKTLTDYFNNSDKKYIKEKTIIAAEQWAYAIQKPIFEVDSRAKANLVIIFKFLEDDGIGGNLALAAFPPFEGDATKTSIRMDLADMYNYVQQRDKAKHTYFTVILHEFGHAAAGLKHDFEFAVMNPKKIYSKLQIDDIIGARVNYKIFDNFNYNSNTYKYLRFTDANKQLTLNFKTKEFITRCSYPRYSYGHFISLNAINIMQYIRTYYGASIKITSTYRDIDCNHIAGGKTNSQHLFRNAIDWKFVGKGAYAAQNKYESDIINKRPLLYALLKLGARGFGSYPNSLNHIDTRVVIYGNEVAHGIPFITWGEFKRKGSFYDPIQEFREND